MPDTFRTSLRNYVVVVLACLVAAIAATMLWLLNREVSWLGIVIPLFVYFDASVLLLTTINMWAVYTEDVDARETCDPILRRYRRTGNVDDLLYGYELWRMEGHGMATRIEFLHALIDQLIEDGYVYEAADLLNDYEQIARTPDTMRAYRRYRKACERRMDAIVAEAMEQERRWEQERRAEERRRELRRMEAARAEGIYQGQSQG